MANRSIRPTVYVRDSKPTTSKDKQDFFCIKRYSTEAERDIVEEEAVEFLEKQELGFSTPRRFQSAYLRRGGSKSGNTELRIAGAILNMVKAVIIRVNKGNEECRTSFTKADLARQVGISERTVYRHLKLVLDKLHEIYGIHSKIVRSEYGKSQEPLIQVWTAELEQIEKQNLRLFDDSLVEKTKRKSVREKLEYIKNEFLPKRSILKNSRLKENLLTTRKRGLWSLAANLTQRIESWMAKNPSKRKRPTVSNIKKICCDLLAQNFCKNEIVALVLSALKELDQALLDKIIFNPIGYFTGICKKKSQFLVKLSPQEVYQRSKKHWESVILMGIEMDLPLCPFLKSKANSFGF